MQKAKELLKTLNDIRLKIEDSKYGDLTLPIFYIPIIIFATLYFYSFRFLEKKEILQFYDTFSTTIFGASASIFGISLAALSVLIAVIPSKAIVPMQEGNLLASFIYPFVINAYLWGTVLIINLVIFMGSILTWFENIIVWKGIFLAIMLNIILIAIIYTIYLSKHVIKITLISFKVK